MSFEGCQECRFKPRLCHGTDGHLGVHGCPAFDHSKCVEYEWTCPCNLERLVERHREVGGFDCILNTPLRSIDIPLPKYIPTFYHDFPGTKPLNLEWIALPLHHLLKFSSKGTIAAIVKTGQELRESLCIQQGTKIVVTGPGPDQTLEDFWRFHRKANLFRLLKDLDIQLFTVPNFSFFSDMPPMHHRYNQSRILRLAERASDAGVNAVLHLNAIHEDAWRGWENLFIKHAEIKFVCLEFQTGYASPVIGEAALARLVKLQDNVGRPLHPILIGAARYAYGIGKNFESCTFIDAEPFLQTFNRKIFTGLPDGKCKWTFSRSKPDESLIPRFKFNLYSHSQRITDRVRGVPPIRQAELNLRLAPSGPLFPRSKQKPVADLPLFCQVQRQLEQNLDPQSAMSPARSTHAPDAPRIAIEKAQGLSKAKLATIHPNSRHKNSLHRRQPNGFGAVKTAGAEDGH
jgi:hypothetical protein